MRRLLYRGKKGQAIVMVTLALVAMVGLMGLAVDFGWAFFVNRWAQAAADSAALAAAQDGLAKLSPIVFACGTALTCQASLANCTISNPPANNLEVGCAYAKQNGFVVGGGNGRQNVAIMANVSNWPACIGPPPTCVPNAPGVAARYWVTVVVTQTVPQLFSAILGNTEATVNAAATAAIADSVIEGSLILINRENDASPVTGRGVNLRGQGGPQVQVPGGISLASRCAGANCPDGNQIHYAGELAGNGSVTAPFTYVRDTGIACAGNIPECGNGWGQSTWTAPYENQKPVDDPMFMDPFRGRGQPPLTTQVLNPQPILGGNIPGGPDIANPTILPPGNYFATDGNGNATGQTITLGRGYFQLGDCSTNFNNNNFVFFGGMRTGAGNTTVKFASGRYVFAGQTGGDGGGLFTLSNGSTLTDCTGVRAQNVNEAGEIFIFTDTNYPGLDVQVNSLAQIQAIRSQLQFGKSGFTMGQNDASSIILHGLNKQHADILGTPLEQFAPVVLWQDQQNSRVKYLPDGNIDTSCGDLDNPCVNNPEDSYSREMKLQATPLMYLYGAAYSPRGAWVWMQAGGNYSGPLVIVAGAMNLQGSPPLTLQGLPTPITKLVAALVQ